MVFSFIITTQSFLGNLTLYNTISLMKVKVTHSCPTLCDPMDYTVHGILQARMLEWVAFPFSKWSSQPRDWTKVSYIAGRFLPAEPQEKPISLIYNSWSNFSSWLNNVLGFCLFVFSGLGLNPASYIACLFYILYSKTISLFFFNGMDICEEPGGLFSRRSLCLDLMVVPSWLDSG